MNMEEIQKLVLTGESQTVEFKKSTGQLRAACETACAFLNGDGGIIIFGITDNQKIIGQEISDKTKRMIGNELAKIAPTANVEVIYLTLSATSKDLIIFKVTTDSTKRPYMYDGRAYIRVQSDTLLMPREYLHQLTLSNSNTQYAWEDQSQKDISLDDLDQNEILSTIAEGILNNRIPENYATQNSYVALQRLGLIRDKQVTNAGVILFAKDPALLFPQCLLRLARFRGKDKQEFIDSKQITGNIFVLIKEAMAFANTYLPVASTFDRTLIERIDTPLFPIPVLREAIVNAICHRDYSHHSGSMSFAIFDDRLEIWNYGLFPSSVSIDSLEQLNQSIPRNRRIANILYYHKIFESWGRGVQMIMAECKKAGHPTPFYQQQLEGTLLTLPSREPIGNTVKTLLPSALSSLEILSNRQQEVIYLLQQHKALSPKKLQMLLETPVAERTLRDELYRLKDLGIVNVRGSTRSREWYLIS